MMNYFLLVCILLGSIYTLINDSIGIKSDQRRFICYAAYCSTVTLNVNSQPYLLDTRLDTHAVSKHHESSSFTTPIHLFAF